MEKAAEIQKQIEKWEARLAQVRESQQKFRSRVSELETERTGLIVDARTKGNEAAKKRIAAIAGEFDAANRELRDDADAVTECTSRLASLRADLFLANRLEEREQLRQFIVERSDKKRPKRIVSLIDTLAAELAGWKNDKTDVAAAIKRFDPQLASVADVLVGQFLEPCRVDYGSGQVLSNFEDYAPKIFDAALAAIDVRLQPGEPVPSDRRAYRAKDHTHFNLHGLECHGGEILYLKPEHAADCVEAGLLEEQAAAAGEVAAS